MRGGFYIFSPTAGDCGLDFLGSSSRRLVFIIRSGLDHGIVHIKSKPRRAITETLYSAEVFSALTAWLFATSTGSGLR